MQTKTILAGLALAFATAGAAHATTFDFNFQGSTYDATGVFTTSGFNITSGSGTLTSSDVSLPQGAFTLYPGSGETPDGQEYYSNTYDPGTQYFGGQGVQFSGSTFELNIYNGVAANFPTCPSNCASVPGTAYYNPGDVGTLTISAVPEPATWALMMIGIGGIGFAFRQAKRHHGFRFKDAFAG